MILGSITVALVRAGVGLPRAAPDRRCASASRRASGSSGTRCGRSPDPARSMALYRLAARRSARPRRRAHRCCCCMACLQRRRRCTTCARHLVARDIGPVYTLSYGPPLASIELFVDQVAAKIDAILAATGARRVAIVGHSMGGLVARAYLRRYGGAKVAHGDDARHAAPRQRPRLALPGRLARAAAAGQRLARRAQSGRSGSRRRALRVAMVVARFDGRAADERAPRTAPRTSRCRHRPQRARRRPARLRRSSRRS